MSHSFRRSKNRGYVSIIKFVLTAFAFIPPALPKDDLAQLYSEAQQAQAAGDLATATRKYEAIIRLQPQMAEASASLANLYCRQGQTGRLPPAPAVLLNRAGPDH